MGLRDLHSFPTRCSSDLTAVDAVLYGAQLTAISEGRVPVGAPTIYHSGNKGTPGRSNWVDSNGDGLPDASGQDRKSTRLNSSHPSISYVVFCLKNKNFCI